LISYKFLTYELLCRLYHKKNLKSIIFLKCWHNKFKREIKTLKKPLTKTKGSVIIKEPKVILRIKLNSYKI